MVVFGVTFDKGVLFGNVKIVTWVGDETDFDGFGKKDELNVTCVGDEVVSVFFGVALFKFSGETEVEIEAYLTVGFDFLFGDFVSDVDLFWILLLSSKFSFLCLVLC